MAPPLDERKRLLLAHAGTRSFVGELDEEWRVASDRSLRGLSGSLAGRAIDPGRISIGSALAGDLRLCEEAGRKAKDATDARKGATSQSP
jgi:hypothetical protein